MTRLAPDEDFAYTRIFDPDLPGPSAGGLPPAEAGHPWASTASSDPPGGDRRPPGGYVFSPRVVLAVNVALATGRPLLVRGEPGSGKSSLAAAVADHAEWDLYQQTITSRTAAQDLLWSFDALRRLHDAQVRLDVTDLARYVRPGALWSALDPVGAREVAGSSAVAETGGRERAVILVDEIDKAEPDVPNDLLEPLGTFTFTVADLGERRVRNTRPQPPLVIITTNGERDLPPAFLRRCAVLTMPFPDPGRLVEIAVRHFGPDHYDLYVDVAGRLAAVRSEAAASRAQAPGTAEYLDAVRACLELGIGADGTSAAWREAQAATLAKWEQP
ncbi:MoxR-like ATPase [Frankia sp. QA3]|nr:MoxR-like ATPase [Frankia sp. QA3]